MELDLGPEIAQFRAELREWIAAEAPDELAGLTDWNMHVATASIYAGSNEIQRNIIAPNRDAPS